MLPGQVKNLSLECLIYPLAFGLQIYPLAFGLLIYCTNVLKVQSYKLYNNYMIAPTANTEIFAFITVLVFSYSVVKFCL